VLIPILIISNLVLHVRSFNTVLNKELQRKAVLFSEGFSANVVDYIDQPNTLNIKINSVMEAESLVKEITVYKFNNDTFSAVATTNPEKELSILSNPASNLAWKEKRSVAFLDSFGGDKVWTVIIPLKDEVGNFRSLLLTKMSTADIDLLAKNTAQQTLIILAITIFFIMLLLINHFRFVGIAKLFYRLKNINDIKNRFLYHVAHDLQNPAVTIRNYSASLQQDVSLSKTQKDSINTIHIASSSIIGMVNNLVNLSQLETGAAKLNRTLSNPMVVCQQSIIDTSNICKEKGITIKTEVSALQGLCLFDLDKLRMAINSILNTLISQMSHGNIIISYKPADDKNWVISLFSPNFQPVSTQLTDSQTYAPRENSHDVDFASQMGIGYWVAEETIRLMEGKLITNYEPGQGTNIYIVFEAGHVAKYPDDSEALPPSTK
jgi:K+-sensing histidine kinase KdpD